MWTAAILAGGQGRRLGGRDKSALQVGARSILDRQLALVRPLTPHMLIIGAPGSSDNGATDTATAGVRRVDDRVANAGALGGLYTALLEAPTEQVLVIACDMPFISAPLLRALADAGEDVDVALPCDEHGRHPLCASYQRRIAPHLKRSIDMGALRIGDALRDLSVRELGPHELAPLNRDGRLLFNVNTPDDFDRARLAAGHDG